MQLFGFVKYLFRNIYDALEIYIRLSRQLQIADMDVEDQPVRLFDTHFESDWYVLKAEPDSVINALEPAPG